MALHYFLFLPTGLAQCGACLGGHGDVAATVAVLQTVATPSTVDTTSLSLDDIFLYYAQEVHA